MSVGFKEELTGVGVSGGGRAAEGGSRRGRRVARARPEWTIELGASSLEAVTVGRHRGLRKWRKKERKREVESE